MPRPSIDYLNARRANAPASGGTNYRRNERAEYAPDSEADAFELAMNAISAFSMWAETTRQVQAVRLAIPQAEIETEIPF